MERIDMGECLAIVTPFLDNRTRNKIRVGGEDTQITRKSLTRSGRSDEKRV
jgi:hypothetical protein